MFRKSCYAQDNVKVSPLQMKSQFLSWVGVIPRLFQIKTLRTIDGYRPDIKYILVSGYGKHLNYGSIGHMWHRLQTLLKRLIIDHNLPFGIAPITGLGISLTGLCQPTSFVLLFWWFGATPCIFASAWASSWLSVVNSILEKSKL